MFVNTNNMCYAVCVARRGKSDLARGLLALSLVHTNQSTSTTGKCFFLGQMMRHLRLSGPAALWHPDQPYTAVPSGQAA